MFRLCCRLMSWNFLEQHSKSSIFEGARQTIVHSDGFHLNIVFFSSVLIQLLELS